MAELLTITKDKTLKINLWNLYCLIPHIHETSFSLAKLLNNSFKDHIQEKNCESLSGRLYPADHHRVFLPFCPHCVANSTV